MAGSRNGRRRRALALVIGVFVLCVAVFAVHWMLNGRWAESTDDAYVGGNLVEVMPQVAGTVVAVHADDTNFVRAGDVLVDLDQADARVALEQAEAQLAKTVRAVRNLLAASAQAQSGLAQREAELERARQDLARRAALSASGALSDEEVQHARDAVASATAARDAARQELAAQRALVEGTTVRNHPDVLNAAARVRALYLDLARTELRAPVSGFVARRSVQIGQRVGPGTPLMTVVPLDQAWVDANFKEGQLAGLRVGQPVRLISDAYGGKVVFHGRVSGFGAGTGSAFALLPAQNASGNWIKVVQRIPVRIALDGGELASHPLQIGLSMDVTVDTHDRNGAQLPQTARMAAADQTSVPATLRDVADARIRAIIAANVSGGAKP